jgi:hypothetical protein
VSEHTKRWRSVERTGKRLGLGRWATLNAVRAGIIPHLPMGLHENSYKIPVDAPGRLTIRDTQFN